MGTGEFIAGGNPAMDWHPIQGGRRNTPSRFMLRKPGVVSGVLGHWLVIKEDFTFFYRKHSFVS